MSDSQHHCGGGTSPSAGVGNSGVHMGACQAGCGVWRQCGNLLDLVAVLCVE